jgi:hypothetical protein
VKYTIENVEFEYNNGLVIGQVLVHDFYLDVYRKKIEINTEDKFQNFCWEAFQAIPERWKGVRH